MNRISKSLLTIVYVLTFSLNSYAGIMGSWSMWMYDQLNKPIASTLNIYRTDGLILVDVGKNYAAYSSSPKKLTEDQMKNISTIENDTGFVLRFDSCGSGKNNQFFDGKITQVRVKSFETEASDLVDEINSLVKFSSSKFTKKGFGVSDKIDDQTFISWEDDLGTTIEVQISKENQQIVWVAYTKDYLCDDKGA